MRFEPESLHDANAGLHVARTIMENIKKDFDWISYGDLWTLGGVAAIQVCFRSPRLRHSKSSITLLIRKCRDPRSLGGPGVLTVTSRMSLLTAVCPMQPRVLAIYGM